MNLSTRTVPSGHVNAAVLVKKKRSKMKPQLDAVDMETQRALVLEPNYNFESSKKAASYTQCDLAAIVKEHVAEKDG